MTFKTLTVNYKSVDKHAKTFSINWPEGFVPGTTDNYACNQLLDSRLTVDDVWEYLVKPKYWTSYYANSENPRIVDDNGESIDQESLNLKTKFSFVTFGFDVNSEVIEFVAPEEYESGKKIARITWSGACIEKGKGTKLDVVHAWLLQDTETGVKILTEETQNGVPAKFLRVSESHPMINGHQDWLKGLCTITAVNKNVEYATEYWGVNLDKFKKN